MKLLILIGLCSLIFLSGCNDDDFCLETLKETLIQVDNSPNDMVRHEWGNKTYLTIRYYGVCKSNEYINIYQEDLC